MLFFLLCTLIHAIPAPEASAAGGPIKPKGTPPSKTAKGFQPFPLYDCPTPTKCNWVKTGLVLDKKENGEDFKKNGVSTGPGSFTIELPKGQYSTRMYLTDPSGKTHYKFMLKNRVLTVDFDASAIPCGFNGAFYFSEMDLDSPTGGNYCDGQTTCSEMDIIEANIQAQQFTPHACTKKGGECDKGGCPTNIKSSGKGYKSVDFSKPYTVSTTFKTNDGTDKGTLSSIEQVLIQGSNVEKLPPLGSCGGGGGFAAMSESFGRGMTMVFSLWGDGGPTMNWLDGGSGSPGCKSVNGSQVRTVFSNLMLTHIDQKDSGGDDAASEYDSKDGDSKDGDSKDGDSKDGDAKYDGKKEGDSKEDKKDEKKEDGKKEDKKDDDSKKGDDSKKDDKKEGDAPKDDKKDDKKQSGL